jgi:hypothetical protein
MNWDIFKEVGQAINEIEKGGPGSGNWGHKGRKGKRGGSAPSKGAAPGGFSSNKDAARSFVNEFNSAPRGIGGKVSIARQDPKTKNTTSVYLKTVPDRSYWGNQLDEIQRSLEKVGFTAYKDPTQKKTTRSFKAGDIRAHARKVKERGKHYIRTDVIDTKARE